MKRLVILGASGHGKVVADIAEKLGYETVVFLDDNTQVKSCGKYPVVGKTAAIGNYCDYDFLVAIGNAEVRSRLQKSLTDQGLHIATLVHPAAVVGQDVSIGAGTVVMAGAVINASAVIGRGCIINTCASVDHDCMVGDYAHVSVGAHLAGTVTLGSKSWIGISAAVSNNICICEGCMIGAGAVVVKDINVSGTYVGVPAKLLTKQSDY